MATCNNQFQKALERFILTLSKDEVEDFRFTKLEDVHKVIGELQEEQGKRKTMMNMTRIASFLEAMDQFGKVIEVFLNSTKFLAFIWGPVKFLLLTSSAWVESFDKLLDAYEQIGETIPLLIQYEALFKNNPYMPRVLELIYYDILEFHRRALKFFKQRAWRQLFRSCWKDFMARFQSILENLRRHKNLVETQATLAHFEAAQVARAAAENNMRCLEQTMIKQQLLSVRDWLCSAKVFNDQDRYASVRSQQANFGNWLLSHRRMVAWLDSTSNSVPLLWLHGIPGAGKTVLTSLIVEKVRQIPDVQVAFFYCKTADPLRNNFVAIARSMLVQILCKNKTMLSHLYERSCVSGESCLETSTLAKELLQTALTSVDRVFLIIDGLDECSQDEKSTIVPWFMAIINNTNESDPGRLRCLFISQDDGKIRRLCTSVPEIKITSADNMVDIQEYVSKKATDLQKKFGLSDAESQDICHKVCDRASGMFLFAKLVMANLYNQTSRAKMRIEVHPDRFPDGLDQAYARIIDSILVHAEKPEKEAAESLLGWLICAKRPLRWHEIQGAISIDTVNKVVDFDNRQLCVDSKNLCGALVEVHPDDSVELVHLTARLYLVDRKYVSVMKENNRLASLCLEYLVFECFNIRLSNQSIRDYVCKGWYAFHDYAVVHWVDHLEHCINAIDNNGSQIFDQQKETALEEIVGVFIRLRWPRPKFQGSDHLDDARRNYNRFSSTDFFDDLLRAVAETRSRRTFGLCETDVQKDEPYLITQLESVRSNLEKEARSLTPNSVKHARFQTYYGEGYFKCKQMGCQYFYKGFETSQARDQHFSKHGRPFNCPFVGCHLASIGCGTEKALTKHMSEFHPSGNEGLNTFPRRKADTNRHLIKVGNLYEVEWFLNGTLYRDIKSEAVDFLKIAIMNGHHAVLQKLLQWGDYSRDERFSALCSAVRSDQTAMMLALMTHKYFYVYSYEYNRLLLTAVSTGRENASKLLIPKCETLFARDRKGHTVIFRASENGHLAIVKQLLDSGMDCGLSREKSGDTSLMCAARNGHENIVRFLLECEGVKNNGTNWAGVAQLVNGARDGDEDLVRQLLQRDDIPINLQTKSGYTPLMLASENGHESIVGLLLARQDIDPNIRQRFSQRFSRAATGPNALGLAARFGHEPVVKLLLDRSDIDATSSQRFDRNMYKPAAIASKFHHDSIATLIGEYIDQSVKPQAEETPSSRDLNGDILENFDFDSFYHKHFKISAPVEDYDDHTLYAM